MLRFGTVVLDVERSLLRGSNGAEISLRPKSLDLLLLLARNPGRVMSRDEVFDAIWPDVTVTEDSIAQCVREVRRAIGDPEGRVLRTVIKRGYCLDVDPQTGAPTAPQESPPRGEGELGRPSLAVLPFQSLPYDSSTEWFANGIVEEVSTALSRFHSLFIIARRSAFNFKDGNLDVRDIGRRLGARYVLAGTIQRAGDQLRVMSQLVDTETGSHVWADRYDGSMSEIFELQDRISGAIAGMLDHRIRRAEIDRAMRKPSAELTAYDLYLCALPGFFAKNQAGYISAKQMLEEAVARDPGFGQARSMLARLAEVGVLSGWDEDVESTRQHAVKLARETLVLDSNDPLVLARCGYVLSILGGMHVEGEALLNRSIAANPHSAEAHIRGGWVSLWNGDFATALSRADMCERLDPLSTFPVGGMELRAAAHFFMREFQEAIDLAKRAVDRAPSYYLARPYLAASLAYSGRDEEARAQANELLRYCPRWTLAQIERNYRFPHEWMVELFTDGLRRAGVPAR